MKNVFVVILVTLLSINIYPQTVDVENWMNLLNDTTAISDISIPGSHNSCTFNTSSSFSKCQTYNLEKQLNMGVRYLDLRFTLKKGKLIMYHGWDNLHISFESCLNTVKDFLEKHSSEIILLRLQKERKYVPNTSDVYYEAITKAFAETGLPLLDTSELESFKIGDLRGKAIVVEYNNLDQNHRTYPHITGYSYWGYLSNKEQVEAKWQDILAKEVLESNDKRLKRFNLYASGGRKILGITIPNPKSFTRLFAKMKLLDIINLIDKNQAISIVDFEELFMNEPGKFYKTIIESNFKCDVKN